MTLKKKTLVITVVGLAAIVLSGIAQYWAKQEINRAWETYTAEAEFREELLADIKGQFGYGGIIHNFKNYVLRGQPKFLDRLANNREAMQADFAQYQTLDLSQEEREALNLIESVMGQYMSNVPVVQRMWGSSATPADIDKAVKINDGPAFEGFAALEESYTAISQDAHDLMDRASILQTVFLMLSFGLLSGVIVAAVLIQRNQTADLDELSRTVAKIEADRNFSTRIHADRSDELGMLTATFDKLLENIESMLALNRAVLDAVPDPIFLHKDGKVVSGNKTAAEFAEVDVRDFAGTAADQVLCRTENVLSSDRYVTCRRKGEEVVLDETSTEVTDKHGERLGSLVVARDVTLIVRQEAEAKASLQTMREVGAEINGAAQELVGATDDLSGRMHGLTEGAQSQKVLSSDAAAAMGEMNQTVLDVARNASGAAESAEEARTQAVEGSEVVARSIDAISSVSQRAEVLKDSMGMLGEHTESIGAVIGVINDIADQTNLLALNAAIEAARAGEAGRGFAVVADEVRKLAEKTMTATKDVADAIESIQQVARQNIEGMDSAAQAVGEATDLAGQSGEALQAIVNLVEGAAQQVSSIAAASEEQSAGSEEVVRSVSEVNDISDQVAHGIQESAVAIQALSDLAQRLEKLAAKAG